MFNFNGKLIVLQIISSAVIISSQLIHIHNNTTMSKNETTPTATISHSLKLKNNNYTKYLSIENNSAIVIPEKDPDSEQIFLPLNGHNYHPDKILERLNVDPKINVYDDSSDASKPFNFLNFEPYIVKPLNVEYSQIFSHLQAKVLKNKNREAQQLLKESKQSIVTHKKPGLHIDTSSYHGKLNMFFHQFISTIYKYFIIESITDGPQFLHEDLQNIDVSTIQTDYDLPTEPPTTVLLNTSNELIQAIIQKVKNQPNTDQQPHTEKLIMEHLPSNFSLPIGLAFFDALNNQNSPYFRSIVLEKPKKSIVSKIRLPHPTAAVPTATEFTIVVNDALSKRQKSELATIAEDYPEFGEKFLPTNLTKTIEDYYDYQTQTTESPIMPTKKKIRNLKKKSKSKKRKPKSKKKYYYDKNTYYPAESKRISTRVGMKNSRIIDAMKQVIRPTPGGVINHSGYSTVQTYSIPKSIPISKPIRQATVENESTAAATNRKAEIRPIKKPPPPPPKELHYFQ